MRIVIDMQGAQSASRFRGIGRYTLSFAQAVAKNCGDHQVVLALSGLFPDTIESLRAAFDGLVQQRDIVVWSAPGPVNDSASENFFNRNIAEIVREAFLNSLQPDIIHVTSLFEGYWDNSVTSIGRIGHHSAVSASLYDLIPLLNPEQYLHTDQLYANHYHRKISSLKKASVLLAISQHSSEEGATYLGKDASRIINISTAISSNFKVENLDDKRAQDLKVKYGLDKPFVLYTGGSDERKNLPRLIEAWASLPSDIRNSHQLLMAGKMDARHIESFMAISSHHGLAPSDIVYSGYVTDEELVVFYNLCKLFVFPSWHEGFGLPALEAMACGAPVIASNTTSLPEVIGLEDALFDPHDTAEIAKKLHQSLTDNLFLQKLRTHGNTRNKLFSWDDTAQRAISIWETIVKQEPPKKLQNTMISQSVFHALSPFLVGIGEVEKISLAKCLAQNEAASFSRQLFVDMSVFFKNGTINHSIPQVDRELIAQLLKKPPENFCVELVYATNTNEYRYARQLTQHLLGQPTAEEIDQKVQWQRGDFLFSLETQQNLQIAQRKFYEKLRREGITVKFRSNEDANSSVDISNLLKNSFESTSLPQEIKPSRQLLVDISELVKHDARSGIQRVVRSILHQWLTDPPEGFHVEPVYASVTEPYRYAKKYIADLLGETNSKEPDALVEIAPGDIFISLDLQHQVAPTHKNTLKEWRSAGLGVWFVVYDLLPIQLPECFVPDASLHHQIWLETISEFDGALCISKAVADDLQQWLRQHPPLRHRPFAVKWFHLGADLDASAPTRGWPTDGARTLEAIKSRPSFLMVSTIEPRKGHEQVVEAFEQLWGTAFDANLVIVGKQGWRVDALVEKMRHHPEAGHRLLWLEGVSDEFLEQIYAASTCLIVASKGEGFGLPLIEAAQHKLPIIARDLPVLREVAGEHALYFVGERANDLAGAVRRWVDLYNQGIHPPSEGMHWLTWKESAASLAQLVLSDTDTKTVIGVTQK